jgi:ABC-type Fe3+ transport system permease subunit
VLVRVTAPLAMPRDHRGAALVFLSTMKELPVTLVLHPTGHRHAGDARCGGSRACRTTRTQGPYALALVVFAAIPTRSSPACSSPARDARHRRPSPMTWTDGRGARRRST